MSRHEAHNDFRAQLDALMGVDRDASGREIQAAKHFWDPTICKNFVLGLCPHDLFTNTKCDLGPCSQKHEASFREAYERVQRQLDFGYESSLVVEFERLIRDSDRRIDREKQRLTRESGIDVESQNVMAGLGEELEKLMAEVETLAEEGKVEESMQLLQRVEELRAQRSVQPTPMPPAPAPVVIPAAASKSVSGNAGEGSSATAAAVAAPAPPIIPMDPIAARQRMQELHVCDICGAMLAAQDSDQSLAIHFGGKQHLGYKAIREKVVEIKALLETPRRKVVRGEEADLVDAVEKGTLESYQPKSADDRDRDSRGGSVGGYRDHDGDGDRDRYDHRRDHRDRDRDSYRDRRRGRSRSRERGRDRDRDRDRDFSPKRRRDRYGY